MDWSKFNLTTIVKDWFGLFAIIIATFTAIGFSVSTPWPARAEVEFIQTNISKLEKQMKDQNCLVLRLLYKTYESDKEIAEKDLEKNPNSISARKAKEEAENSMREIGEQFKAACKVIRSDN